MTREPDTAFLSVLFGCLLCLTSISVTAAPQYVATSWDNDSGLPQNSVQAIVQSRDGYLWLGTQFGLACFDGVEFTVFDTNNVPELHGRNISCLTETQDGTLWIGTFDAGLTAYRDGKFTHYGSKEGLPSDYIKTLCETSDGTLWVASLGGLFRFENQRFFQFGSAEEFKGSYTVRTMLEDHEGSLWIGTAVSLVRCHDDEVVEIYTAKEGLPVSSLRGLAEDKNGDILVGGSGGVARLHQHKFSLLTKKQGLSDNNTTALFVDSHTNLWVGSYGGLNRLVNGRFTTERTEDGMAYDMVNMIMEDREGDIWVGAKDGLCRLTLKQFATYTQQQGLSHNNVISTTQGADGTIWVGTWGGGLNEFKDGRFRAFAKPGMPTELVLGIHQDREGSIWFGTDFDGGLFRLRTNQFTRFGHKEGITAPAIRAIFDDSNGDFWVGTSGGLFTSPSTRLHFTAVEALKGIVVRDIREDRDGVIWVATDSGLGRIKNGKLTLFTTADGLSSNVIVSLFLDREGTLWIGTRGGGLNCYRANQFHSYTTKDGLSNNDVFAILEDDAGYFWMTSRRGIFRVRKQDLADYTAHRISSIMSVSFGKGDGMGSTECNSIAKPSAFKAFDGKLWFATAKGLVMTDPAAGVRANTNIPPVMIEKIVIDKHAVPLNGSSVHLPPARGDLEFHYTALSFSASEKNRFRYRLDGVDTEWQDADTRRVAYYNHIGPGSYTFRVIGCNNDGVWNNKGATLQVVLQPHLWQTWWFTGLLGLIAVTTVAGTARVMTAKRLKRRLERLEQQHAVEKERMRIAKDMHDEIGAKLTKISFLSEVAKRELKNNTAAEQQIETVATSAREVLHALDEIVWAVNPKNDTLDNFATYLCRYVSEFFSSTSILAELEIPSTLPAAMLSTDVRHNLVLAIKETLNNVLKHAKAERVSVELSIGQAEVRVTIKDDGRGFHVLQTSEKQVAARVGERVGNGLANIRHRLQQAGGSCHFESSPGKGTTVIFNVPLRKPEA